LPTEARRGTEKERSRAAVKERRSVEIRTDTILDLSFYSTTPLLLISTLFVSVSSLSL